MYKSPMNTKTRDIELEINGRLYLVDYSSEWFPAEPEAGFMTRDHSIEIEMVRDYGKISDENDEPVAIYSENELDSKLKSILEDKISWEL